MSPDQTAKPPARKSQSKSTDATPPEETLDAESTDVKLEATTNGNRGVAIVPRPVQGTALSNRPVHDHRPGPLPGNRPITPSKTNFRYSAEMPHRPIATSIVPTRPSEALPGNRPIVLGGLQVFKPSNLPGGRPIATNVDSGINELIGYLD